mmetsp:Transcript_26167/g.25015  ORF Transcript_26167/g.25015 Transcript_26167/m.25015 type:complete len:96 (+) Transcript_26167:319-606(+)
MVLPKTITIKSNDNDDDNAISKKKDAIMNMNVLPLEIINTSNDAEASILLCCPPEISTNPMIQITVTMIPWMKQLQTTTNHHRHHLQLMLLLLVH